MISSIGRYPVCALRLRPLLRLLLLLAALAFPGATAGLPLRLAVIQPAPPQSASATTIDPASASDFYLAVQVHH